MKRLISKIGNALKSLFGKEFDMLKKYSGVAVEITNTLKKIVESPVVSTVVHLTPTNVDNQILYHSTGIIRKVALQMAVAHSIIQLSTAHTDVVAGIVDHLRSLNPEARVGFWIEFAGRVNHAFADGKMSFPEAVALAQLVYAEKSK